MAEARAQRLEYDRERLYRSRQVFRPGRDGVVQVGNAHGKVAVYLDEVEAIDLAQMYGHDDGMYDEILAAVEAAYPSVASGCSCPGGDSCGGFGPCGMGSR